MSSKMSRNKKKKLKKKAKKFAEKSETQTQESSDIVMREQSTADITGTRVTGDYDGKAEEEQNPQPNGTERLSADEEEYVVDSSDHTNHVSSMTSSSCHDICNGHHCKSQARVVSNDVDICCVNDCNNEGRNRLERSESTLVPDYRKSKDMGMRRVASCPGITTFRESYQSLY